MKIFPLLRPFQHHCYRHERRKVASSDIIYQRSHRPSNGRDQNSLSLALGIPGNPMFVSRTCTQRILPCTPAPP